ncbi:MAG: DUF1992 domain-containing protein [Deltaproteobacteria bacterium]|nr:DUF1992 domain-containing protein [Deltaproteobacteria bacterium]
MITGFEKIVEQRILAAQRDGEFENLEGAGEPLNHDMFTRVHEDLRLAYKILKNADCLPPEIELKKEIRQTETLLSGINDVCARYKTLKKLNFLIMKLNTISKSSIQFEVPQKYELAIIERISKSC